MAFKREHVEKWLATQFPGERLVSMVATGVWSISYTGAQLDAPKADRLLELRRSLGLNDELRVGAGYATTFYALTESQIILGTRSDFLNRPKDLLYAAPIDGFMLHWFDDTDGPNRSRYFITEFGDGKWRSDRTGLTALGNPIKGSTANEFIQALGSHATQVLNP